ncbi:carboxymuconolactone decarboxylase family protein [Actinokineospora xionganensis]|uniref:Carboxymuconolactone decarboxylase family protein n=1 Tax=Actinokineospora xionganensis TaxID=2684470 RepID=A0ABR7LDG6_9PSEU|nr:carboxymuconolactone decarboxylase family protein [Actinokineospora xionganensis]MBC6450533.1 carboxymuconolactone decarboxylase family protein [Actinokineospora xionganensis]
MGGTVIRAALRSALNQVLYVDPVRPRQARDVVATVYQRVEREFGMLAPPIALHSPSPTVLAASWVMLRESLLARGELDRATKEVVAAGVSVGNGCPYCVQVHSATFGGLVHGPAAAALSTSRVEDIADDSTRALALWARDSAFAHARPPSPTAETVGVAVTFHYLNRMVSVFLGDSPLPPNVPAGARGPATRFLGRFMRSSATAEHRPGDSLDLLPPAPVGQDLWWAADSPTIADAFARAYAVIDEAGDRAVPADVRALVIAQLAQWDGRPRGVSRAWAGEAVSVLSPRDRPIGMLALLTAMAAYQIDPSVVDDAGLSHSTLIELTSWSSLTAARRVAAVAQQGKTPGHSG